MTGQDGQERALAAALELYDVLAAEGDPISLAAFGLCTVDLMCFLGVDRRTAAALLEAELEKREAEKPD